MARSDYTYKIDALNGMPFIIIEDLNKGRMSVTNDIENVVEEIAIKQRINPVEHHIIYRDSEGMWDGFEFSTKQFISLERRTATGAMYSMLKR